MAVIYWPFDPGIINYGFGYPPGYGGFHNGIDFPVPQGTPLRATAAGTVRAIDAGAVDGAGIDIITPDGWKVRHWHLSRFDVANGQTVNAGDIIGLTGGQPGTWGAGNATGAHLHWGLMIGGNWVNPADYSPNSFDNKPDILDRKEDTMKLCHIPKGALKGTEHLFLLFSENFYLEFTGQDAANAFAKQCGGNSAPVSKSFFDKVKKEVDAGRA